jgi:phenylalanyl-tRNA synthetase beta chain
MLPHPLRDLEEKTKDFLAGLGLFETITSSLVNPALFESLGFDLKEGISIHNPIHQELTLLRPSFLVSLLEALARNERAGERSLGLFEVANLYSRKGKGEPPQEEKALGILLAGEREAGWSDTKRALNFFDLKGILEGTLDYLGIQNLSFSPQEFPFFGAGSRLDAGKESLGFLGEITQGGVFYAELSLEKLVRLLPRTRKFKEYPRYPAVERDLSLVVEESVRASDVLNAIESLGQGLIQRIELFDLFRGGRIPRGQKNLAFRLRYQSLERTLVSEEIQRLHDQIASELARKFRAAFQETKSTP